jgi:cytochrome b
MADESASGSRATIWDLPTRLFHWSLVLLIAGAWWTQEQDDSELHARIGYAVLTLLLFRLAWGFVGSDTSRFASFIRGPRSAILYLRGLFGSAPAPGQIGHNPVGGYSVVLMLLCLAVQAGTGLFLYDDEFFWGPLNDLVSEESAEFLHEVHELNFNLLLALIVVHVAAILFYRFGKGQHLVGPMIGGKATLPPGSARPRIANPWLALALLIVSAGLVYALLAFI